MKPLSKPISSVSASLLGRKNSLMGRLWASWEEIMGEDIARQTVPSKIGFRKVKNSEAKEATLTIAVFSSAAAARLVYKQDLILERARMILGEDSLTKIKFEHRPGMENIRLKPSQPKPLKQADTKEIQTILESIEDIEIKERLQSLGAYIYADNQ